MQALNVCVQHVYEITETWLKLRASHTYTSMHKCRSRRHTYFEGGGGHRLNIRQRTSYLLFAQIKVQRGQLYRQKKQILQNIKKYLQVILLPHSAFRLSSTYFCLILPSGFQIILLPHSAFRLSSTYFCLILPSGFQVHTSASFCLQAFKYILLPLSTFRLSSTYFCLILPSGFQVILLPHSTFRLSSNTSASFCLQAFK